MQDLYKTLDAQVGLFDRKQIPYVMIGEIAVRAHAIPRNTVDLDLMLAVRAEQLSGLLEELVDMGVEVPEPYLRGWTDRIREMPPIKARYYLSGRALDADLFLVESSFHKSIMRRRVAVAVNAHTFWIATAEDLVLLKLLADRPRDRLDVADLFFISGPLNVAYLRQWAVELGIEAALESALREAGGG